MSPKNLEWLCGALLDRFIDRDGVESTLEWLKEYGLSKENCVFLGFAESDVDEVFDK